MHMHILSVSKIEWNIVNDFAFDLCINKRMHTAICVQ